MLILDLAVSNGDEGDNGKGTGKGKGTGNGQDNGQPILKPTGSPRQPDGE